MANFNLDCEKLRESYQDLVNNSGLPAAAVFYVTQSFFRDLEMEYTRALQIAAMQEGEKEESITVGEKLNDKDAAAIQEEETTTINEENE